MKNLLLTAILISSTLLFAQEGKINKGETWYRIYPKKSLQITNDADKGYFAQVLDGDELVFEYQQRKDEYADMTDDEYTEKILFSVPKKAASFNYTGTTLKAAFLMGCFCPDRGWHQISDGFIKGKKLKNNTWKVEMDVMTKADPSRHANSVTRKMNVIFKPVKPIPVKKK